ncbi:hypothetical protein KL86DPRO_10162 [uncultured delta proteobacterium]|uniref:Uncharacterized protein n=1 Tax=uncultured delta proteobacterium TaxID=34034 RepID=A0A212IVP7_9DELT|nr:hypothetical protein KL86DPRO_10162 [uncultured delta proteobacterium]
MRGLDLCLGGFDLPHAVHGRAAHGIAPDGPLRDQYPPLVDRFLQNGPHEHAGEQEAFPPARGYLAHGVVELGAHGNGAGSRINGDIRELERAFDIVELAVLKLEFDLGRAVPGGDQPAFHHGPLQPQEFRAGLGQVHVHLVHPLDGRKRLALVRGNKRAGRHRGNADMPGNGGVNLGVADVDGGGIHGGLGRDDFRPGLVHAGEGVVVFLSADGVDLDRLRGAVRHKLRGGKVGLGPQKSRLGLGKGGFIQGRVYLVELLAFRHFLPFVEQALLDDARHLRPHFGDLQGGGAPAELGGEFHALRFHRQVGDLGRRHLHLLRPLVATGKKRGGHHAENGQKQYVSPGDTHTLTSGTVTRALPWAGKARRDNLAAKIKNNAPAAVSESREASKTRGQAGTRTLTVGAGKKQSKTSQYSEKL